MRASEQPQAVQPSGAPHSRHKQSRPLGEAESSMVTRSRVRLRGAESAPREARVNHGDGWRLLAVVLILAALVLLVAPLPGAGA